MEPIGSLPRLSLLLLKPEFGVPTPWAYQRWQGARELPSMDYAAEKVGGLIFQNDLERPVFEKHLFLAQMKVWLRKQPEVVVALLSGSGSTLFAVLHEDAGAASLAERARTELDRLLWTCVVQTNPGGQANNWSR